jgi:uncharacterized membrane protein
MRTPDEIDEVHEMNEVERPSSGPGGKLAMVAVIAIVGYLVIQFVFGLIFGFLKTLLVLALVGVGVWFLVVGPPGKGKD